MPPARNGVNMRAIGKILPVVFLLSAMPAAAESPQVERAPSRRVAAEVAKLVETQDLAGLRERGPAILPQLVELYRGSDEAGKANVAWIFYELGWKSEAAKDAMMADVHTADANLRLQVQWALGRVSADDAVVDVLLDNLQNDQNPLFRDKAACGLASDQIHLTDSQKARLYERVIGLLESPRVETRRLAIQILEVHTGQRKGYIFGAPEAVRADALAAWKRWLAEYREALP